ncbi:hypothetical protein J437_LFUL019247 [Ladona fulva]|uniref:Peptidase aspartic putative domain-containing protein n=1 Tax=Ladona fulva TaxID=123851 RepID=A0A8K0PA91_LADFU|nr:hypothetical protein J437_LFUL019247 [Ladona fulva]
MADPGFHKPDSVDLILGVDLCPKIFLGGGTVIWFAFKDCNLVLVDSIFGWILMGSIVDSSLGVTPCESSLCAVEEVPLVTQLKRFWELEESTVRVAPNPEEIRCEELFVKTHRRNASGTYIVSLPFRSELPSLGESYSQAAKRFINLERKLLQRPRLKA